MKRRKTRGIQKVSRLTDPINVNIDMANIIRLVITDLKILYTEQININSIHNFNTTLNSLYYTTRSRVEFNRWVRYRRYFLDRDLYLEKERVKELLEDLR